MTTPGTLYLIPTPLGPGPLDLLLPPGVIERVRTLTCFVAENAKSARAFLKSVEMPCPLAEVHIAQLSEHTKAEEVPGLLRPLLDGFDMGLVSEAGAPGVADPGAALVRAAHAANIPVRPLVGPSSILLGLMASGLEGQRFTFHGYLPVEVPARTARLRELEALSRKEKITQIFIETPYRNAAMFDALLALHPQTQVCVARELATAEEWICTDTVAGWRRRPKPELHKRPALFMLLG